MLDITQARMSGYAVLALLALLFGLLRHIPRPVRLEREGRGRQIGPSPVTQDEVIEAIRDKVTLFDIHTIKDNSGSGTWDSRRNI